LELGHLLYPALTCPPSGNAWHLISRHTFGLAAHLISSSDNNNIRAAQWADHQWNAERADDPTRLRTLIPDTGTHTHPEWPSQEKPGSGSTASAPASDVSAPVYTNEVRPLLSVAQNKPPTMLSSKDQSIELTMDCTTWQFWMTKQSIDSSEPAPRSSATKQWIERTGTNDVETKQKQHPWLVQPLSVKTLSKNYLPT